MLHSIVAKFTYILPGDSSIDLPGIFVICGKSKLLYSKFSTNFMKLDEIDQCYSYRK